MTVPVCATCGRTAETFDSALLTWSFGIEHGHREWTCDECVRRYVRSIESRLTPEWW